MGRKNGQSSVSETKDREKKNEWFFVNPYLVGGAIGASLCFTWFFSILTTPDFVGGSGSDPLFPSLAHFAFTVALLVGYTIIWLFSDWFQRHRSILVAFALVCAVANVLGFPLNMVPELRYGLAILGGFGVSSLMTLWIEFVCVLWRTQIRSVVAAMLALSFFWYSGTAFINESILPVFITVYAFLSGCIYVFLHRRFALMDDLPDVAAKDSDTRLKITWKPSLLTVMGSVAQGFALYWLFMPHVYTFEVSLLVEGLSLVVFTLLLIDSQRSCYLRESTTRRLFLPVLAASILPLCFLPQEFWVGPCILAFLFSLLPYASAIFATCEHIVRYGLSSFRTFSWARLFSSSGLLIGLTAGWVAFSTEVLGAITLPVMVVIVMMFFIVVTATLNMGSYYPGEEQKRNEHVKIGPHGEIVAEVPDHKNSDSGVKYFHLKCDAVAGEYELSKRQTEVLHLLAKGRNAEYIQKQLFISPHTAKAHIYNIYRKTGSHSRQDLMDLVENTVIDEESEDPRF